MLWYAINLFIILIFVLLLIIVRRSDKRWLKINDYLGMVANTVNSVRYGNLAAKIMQDFPNCKNLSESINRMVETLNDREKMIIEYQNELMRQNRFLEAVINSLSDGILIIEEHGVILRITPQIEKWFGDVGNNLINKNLFDYVQIPDGCEINNLNSSEVFIKNNPQLSFCATTMNLVLDDAKKRFVIIIKDITNERELERLREDFVATLTHDLKVPIVAEANILDFLINGKFGEINNPQHEAIANMRSCNEELLDLVQILLETYKVNETGIDLNKESIEVVSFVKNVIDEMLPIAQKSELEINFAYDDNVLVNIDKMQLERAVKNLIQNAISHSGTSHDIDVKISKFPDSVGISIIDHGKGIKEEDIDKVFEKYYSTARKFRKIGTGLGLYLSKQIVKSHGGEITVKSEPNVSTEFCIKLPL